jgi:serine/threonine protein kinase
MRCPACQAENPPTAPTCNRCGGPLSESVAGSALGGTGGFGAGGPLQTEPRADRGSGIAPPPSQIPERFENYEILRKEDGSLWELGRGAMGITYKAVDVDLQVPVALKVISPNVLGNSDAAERFLREARSAAKLRHGNIASVFRLGKSGDTPFYAMEFCEGQTVHQLVERRGPLELKLAIEITLQVTHALVVAQDFGVVHRDIKPSNLMVTGRVPDEFTVKVIDFGLAKHTAADSAAVDITIASGRRGFVGTAHFASPEQLEDRPVDFRSDIYSLGVTLWFMLTGRPLFEGSLTRVVTQHLVQKAPIEKLPWLPARMAELLDMMLAKEPEARPASTRELRDRLQFCLEEVAMDVTCAAQPGMAPPPASAWRSGPASSAPPASAPPVQPPMSSAPPAAASGARIDQPPTFLPPAVGSTPGAPPPIPAVPPPMPSPAFSAAGGPPAIPTHKPTSAGPMIILAILFVVGVGVLGAGWFGYQNWVKPRLGGPPMEQPIPVATSEPEPLPDVPPSTPPTPAAPSRMEEAIRSARLALDAAEKMSKSLHNEKVQQALVEVQLERPTPDAEAIDMYRGFIETSRLNFIDGEATYLRMAKLLNTLPDQTYSAAMDRLEEEISSVGVNRTQRTFEAIQAHIPKVAPDAARIDADFRAQLEALQNP